MISIISIHIKLLKISISITTATVHQKMFKFTKAKFEKYSNKIFLLFNPHIYLYIKRW